MTDPTEVAIATQMEQDSFNDSSSDFSSPPSSPSCSEPTPEPTLEPTQDASLPSPPSSHQSASGTPAPEALTSQDGGPPPAKRRKITPKMPRETRHLNLYNPTEEQTALQQGDMDNLAKALREKRKIVVIAGAGISVSAGIPDFRSSTGLFKALKSQHKLKGSGKHLFDASVYRDDATTTSFHHMVRSLSTMTKSAKPTAFHHLVARLAQEGRLLRLYSQNVDGIDTSLEPLATKVPLPRKGPWPKTVQLHGGLDKMMCTKCNALSDFDAELFDGPVPPQCNVCMETDQVRTEVAGKRSHGIGMLRPRMVLYNEHNPDDEAIGSVTKSDLRTRPDAVIVVGTSLKVPGVRRIVKEMCGVVRGRRDGLAVWINRDPVPAGKIFEDSWDLIVNGTSDAVAELVNLGKWDEYDMSIGEFSEVTQGKVDEVKEKSELQVVVESPSKNRIKDFEAIPTPVASPRPLLKVSNILEEPTETARPTLFNPASHGKSITQVLGAGKPTTSKKASKTSAKAPKAKETAQKKTAPKKTSKPAANQAMTINFKTTKATAPTKEKNVEPPSKPEPSTPRKTSSAPNLYQMSPNQVRFPGLAAKAAAQLAEAR